MTGTRQYNASTDATLLHGSMKCGNVQHGTACCSTAVHLSIQEMTLAEGNRDFRGPDYLHQGPVPNWHSQGCHEGRKERHSTPLHKSLEDVYCCHTHKYHKCCHLCITFQRFRAVQGVHSVSGLYDGSPALRPTRTSTKL